MYRVLCDGLLLYDDLLEGFKIFKPKLELELNKTGSFEFAIYPDHPYFDFLNKLKSIITVYQDDYMMFRGRILDDEIGFYNEKQVSCEGELAFLIDSLQRPFDFNGTISEFLSFLIDRHNEQVDADKRFTLGTVSVTDPNNYIHRTDSEYQNTLETIQKGLLDTHGGYLWIRHVEDITYLDYLEDFHSLSTQEITFAKNLLDLKRIRNGDDIATVLIPLGAKVEGSEDRLTIKTVNDGKDYLEDTEAVEKYGRITVTHKWDDVTEASNLLTKATAYFAELVKLPEVIELSAADLAAIDVSVNSFKLGTYVNVTSNPHGIGQRFLVNKLSINLLEPATNKLVLGGEVKTFTGMIKSGINGKDAVTYTVEIRSSNGNFFKNGVIDTILSCHVFKNDIEITDSINASRFYWQKINNDGTHDTAWETSHSGGTKEIHVNSEDVQSRATFTCTVDGL